MHNRPTHGEPSHDTRHMSPAALTLWRVLNEPADRLLTAREVCDLLHIARSTLPLWRARGDLKGYRMENGHFRYPSNQPAIAKAKAALRAAAVTGDAGVAR